MPSPPISTHAGSEARRAGRGVAAEPGRGGDRLSRLLAQRLCLQPVAAPELHGRRDRRACSSAPAPRRCSPSPATAPTRKTADIFAAAAELPLLRRVYSLGDGPTSAAPFPTEPALLPVAETNPDEIVYLAFTSGTTGTPKGVMHSDNTLLANGRAMVADWHHDERDRAALAEPALASHRHRGDRPGAGGGHGAGGQLAARTARPRSTGSSRPARPM